MADNNIYQQDGTTNQKKSKKPYIIIGCVILFIVLLIMANVSKAKEEKRAAEQAALEAQQTTEALPVEETTQEQLSEAELEQQALIQVFGEPPAGFRWNDDGEPVAISDENLTGEEVVYNYLRALSMLDMANAAKYAQVSTIINTYENMFSIDNSGSYSNQFARKMLSEVLTSIEPGDIERSSVFANGRHIYTINIDLLDLTYKDFWKDEKEDIFTTIRGFTVAEQDSIKMQQFIQDKILEYYSRDDAKKRTVQVDIVLDKVRLGGWLVTDDADLQTACMYTDGNSVYTYIMTEYQKWLEDTLNAEEEQREKELEEKQKAEEASREAEEAAGATGAEVVENGNAVQG